MMSSVIPASARFSSEPKSSRGRVAAAGLLGAHGHEGHADHQDHRAGDDRGEQPQQAREVGRDEEREDARDDHRAVDLAQAVGAAAGGLADGDHRRHRGEGDALEQGQPDAHLPEADGLDDRGDAAREEVGVDEVDEVLSLEPDRAGQEDGHDHRAGVEGEHVLGPVDRELPGREHPVDGVHAAPPGAPAPSPVPRPGDIAPLSSRSAGRRPAPRP